MFYLLQSSSVKQAALIWRLTGTNIFRVEVCSTQILIRLILPFQRSTFVIPPLVWFSVDSTKFEITETKPLKDTYRKAPETVWAGHVFINLRFSTFQLCLLPAPTEKRPFISMHHVEGCQSLLWVHQWCKAVP